MISSRNGRPRRDAAITCISLEEYQSRRSRLLKALGGAAGVVLAGEGNPPLLGRWRPDPAFYYLTGIDDEPGAAVLLDPSAENPKRRCTLFLRPLNPERERWDGYRQQVGTALRQSTGFQTVLRTDALPGALTAAARRCRELACLHGPAVYPAAVSPDLALFKQVADRVPGVRILDRTSLLPAMRAVKSAAEMSLIRRAIAATAAGYARVLKMIRPGLTERRIEHALEQTYREHGADALAFNSIVGAGLQSTVLHYSRNSGVLEEGALVLIDSGAQFGGYAADITRTFPVSGRFSPAQREVYEVVLRAQLAAIRAARPGARMHEVDEAARSVIDKAGYADAFIHGIGHQLGLEVHDATPDGPLRAGMVITIEPGVYLPDAKIGVRIEDDVLISRQGAQVLTAAVPKTVREIESAMS